VKRRLLLGTSGTGTTWGILSSLRERWGESVWVLASDMAPAHLTAAAALADAFVQVPAIDDHDFAETLLQTLTEEQITTYLPTYDSEIVLAARLRNQGLIDSGVLIAPPLWSAETCWDKLLCGQWLAEQGLPAPASDLIDRFPWHEDGVFVKPRKGVGSKGARLLSTPEELSQFRATVEAEAYVAQEALHGQEVTLDCFLAPSGYSRVICRERIEVKSGVCTKARVFEDAALTELALDVGKGLELRGSYCLQVIGKEDVWRITDVNPRTGAGTRISAALGLDFPAANLALAWGEDPGEVLDERLDRDRWVVRQYHEVILD
jgi:carbamoyl-phosphate synthase large subunit